MIRGVAELREAYRSTEVARTYVDERFVEPLGALLHKRQVEVVAAVIRELQPQRVLEIAPGPARVTRDVAPLVPRGGVVVDASLQMLAEARPFLPSGRWRAVQGDAFSLPIAGGIDLAYSFRLIRHFERTDRLRLYREIFRVVRPGGYLVFDAVNRLVSEPIRRRDPEQFKHYDALLRPEEIREELQEAGFELVALQGVQHRYPSLAKIQILVAARSRRLAAGLMGAIDAYAGGEPLEWVVVCRRR